MARLVKILVVLAFIAYPIVLHTFILKEEMEMWALLFVLGPLLGLAAWMALRTFGTKWWPLVVLVAIAVVYFIVTGDHGRIGLVAVNGLSHATLNLFLLWLFGRTLLPGREPLISQISRHINGSLGPEIAVYTRWVTIAWCIFFFVQVATSLSLYVFAPLAVWSFFINVLNTPLLVLMFVGEKAYRTTHFPNHPKTSIMKALEVYSKDFASPRKKEDSEH